jgi:hypothetical protein
MDTHQRNRESFQTMNNLGVELDSITAPLTSRQPQSLKRYGLAADLAVEHILGPRAIKTVLEA